MKKDVLNLLVRKDDKADKGDNKHLVTLEEWYGHKLPVYERFVKEEMKL